ncbi:MAG: DHH family phosphoesterase [Chloroflexi bacterium]|nr:DHH family phosphoesterase [Chloroflexota bacterium]
MSPTVSPLPANSSDGNARLSAARERLHSASHILLVTHVSPDGDAIGSLCGLGLALRHLGKKVTLACDDPVPEIYKFIPASLEVVKAPRANFPADLFIAVDCADLARAGKVSQAAGRAPDFNFDHHLTNPAFAEFNFVDADAAATAEVLYESLDSLGLPLTLDVAECLLTGLIADTIGFRTSNVNQRTLRTAMGLMGAGASLPNLYDLTLNRRSFAAARLWGEGLVRLQLDDGLVWTTLPLHARAAAGYRGIGDADLVNVLTTIYEAKVAIVFVERAGGEVKISLRAHPGVDVSIVAQAFGGGGHAAAAGAEVKGTLEEVQARVLPMVRELMQKTGASNVRRVA